MRTLERKNEKFNSNYYAPSLNHIILSNMTFKYLSVKKRYN